MISARFAYDGGHFFCRGEKRPDLFPTPVGLAHPHSGHHHHIGAGSGPPRGDDEAGEEAGEGAASGGGGGGGGGGSAEGANPEGANPEEIRIPTREQCGLCGLGELPPRVARLGGGSRPAGGGGGGGKEQQILWVRRDRESLTLSASSTYDGGHF